MYYQTNSKQTRVKFDGAAGCSRVLCRRAGAGNGLFVDALRPRRAGLFLFGLQEEEEDLAKKKSTHLICIFWMAHPTHLEEYSSGP